MRRFWVAILAVFTFTTLSAQVSLERPYAVGADISWLQSQEDSGVHFSDGGVEGDAMLILRDN